MSDGSRLRMWHGLHGAVSAYVQQQRQHCLANKARLILPVASDSCSRALRPQHVRDKGSCYSLAPNRTSIFSF